MSIMVLPNRTGKFNKQKLTYKLDWPLQGNSMKIPDIVIIQLKYIMYYSKYCFCLSNVFFLFKMKKAFVTISLMFIFLIFIKYKI